MSVLHHPGARLAALLLGLFVASAQALPGTEPPTPGPGPDAAVTATTIPEAAPPPTPTEIEGSAEEGPAATPPEAGAAAEAPAAEMGVESGDVGPAEAGESAQAVPYIGTQQVWCTQGNPSPGVCGRHHTYPAIDIGMPTGTTIHSAGDGVVHEVQASSRDARGLYVAVRHPDGVYSRYLHLSAVSVRVGQAVQTGSVLGRSGSTGSSTAPHLHYDEQRPYGTPKSVGTMRGYSGATEVTYPNAFGPTSWAAVPYGSRMRNDGFTPPAPVTPRQWGGPSVATGDFNGDGFADVATGIPGKDVSGRADSGAVAVAYGGEGGLTTEASQQFVPGRNGLAGVPEAGDSFGASVAAGDFDGDGHDDLVVGAPREDLGQAIDAGAVIVIRGSGAGLTAAGSRQWYSGADGLLAGQAETGDQLGASLTTGDFDADGTDDLAVGAPGEDGAARDVGAVVVAPGSASGLTRTGARQVVSGANGVAGRSQPGDLLGAAVVAGDFDGDGHDDLAAGSPGEDIGRSPNAGQVIVVAGGPGGLDRADSRQLRSGLRGMTGRAERDDVVGAALTAGDLDDDGSDELVIGAPGEDASGTNDGAIAVVPGTEDGATGAGSRQYWSGSRGSAGTPHDHDLLGASLASGDVDGDGESEIVVGVPGEDIGAALDAGAVVVIGTTDEELSSDSPGVAGRSETADRLGRAVALGDLDGDGLADLVATAPTEGAFGVTAAGAVTVVAGSDDNGLAGGASRQVLRGRNGMAGTAKEGDQLGGLLPPYLF